MGVGIPLVYFLLLKRASRAIVSERHTSLSRALAFFHADYEPKYYWWELVETYRKVILVGFATLTFPGEITQLGMAVVFCLVVLVVTVFAEPYRRRDTDLYAIFCSRDWRNDMSQ